MSKAAMPRIINCPQCRSLVYRDAESCHVCGFDVRKKPDRRIFTRQSVGFIVIACMIFTMIDLLVVFTDRKNERLRSYATEIAQHLALPLVTGIESIDTAAAQDRLGGSRSEREAIAKSLKALREMTGVLEPDAVEFDLDHHSRNTLGRELTRLSFRLRFEKDCTPMIIRGVVEVTSAWGKPKLTLLRYYPAVLDWSRAPLRSSPVRSRDVDDPGK
jgi:hypothetical protein